MSITTPSPKPTSSTMLSHEQNLELFKQLETADSRIGEIKKNSGEASGDLHYWLEQSNKTRNQLILGNKGLVASLASKYAKCGVGYDDLMQEGFIGLSKAIEKFDYRRGNKLSTYAVPWIKQSMTRALSKQARTIRIPEGCLAEIRKLNEVVEQFSKEHRYDPSGEEIAWEMGISARRVSALLAMRQPTISMHTPVGDADGATIIDFVADSSVVDPGEKIDMSIRRKWLNESYQLLTVREIQVIKLRHSIDHTCCHGLDEIGNRFGVSGERIRQILIIAEGKISDFVKSKEQSYRMFLNKSVGAMPGGKSDGKNLVNKDIQPVKEMEKIGLATRSTQGNPDHHIWNNNGTWYCKFRAYAADGGTKTFNKSLKTKSVEEARIRRDEMMSDYNGPAHHFAA